MNAAIRCMNAGYSVERQHQPAEDEHQLLAHPVHGRHVLQPERQQPDPQVQRRRASAAATRPNGTTSASVASGGIQPVNTNAQTNAVSAEHAAAAPRARRHACGELGRSRTTRAGPAGTRRRRARIVSWMSRWICGVLSRIHSVTARYQTSAFGSAAIGIRPRRRRATGSRTRRGSPRRTPRGRTARRARGGLARSRCAQTPRTSPHSSAVMTCTIPLSAARTAPGSRRRAAHPRSPCRGSPPAAAPRRRPGRAA